MGKSIERQRSVPQLLALEVDAIDRELRLTTEKGSIVGYSYSLRTEDRDFAITANYKSLTDPRIRVESADTVVDKMIDVNGIPAHLIAVKEFDGYWIYLEHNDWKIVINGLSRDSASNKTSGSSLTENEALSIAQSIKW